MYTLPLTADDVKERLLTVQKLTADYAVHDAAYDAANKYIRVDLEYTIEDGSEIKFKAPVDGSEATGLIVYYTNESGSIASATFTFADAHGNDLGDIDPLFASGAVIKVILEITLGKAFIQNADTNVYLEQRFQGLAQDLEHNSEWESIKGKPFTYSKELGEDIVPSSLYYEDVDETEEDGHAYSTYGFWPSEDSYYDLIEGQTYEISYNGKQYIGETKIIGNCIFLGNYDVASHRYTGVGIPCCVEIDPENIGEYQDYIHFVDETTMTSFPSDFSIRPCNIINLINEESIPDTIARVEDVNWNSLKDKPFTKQNVSILPNDFSWTNSGDSYIYDFTENIPLKDGKQYKVIINEEQYVCPAKYIYEADEEVVYLGNGDVGGFGQSSTEPFFITANYIITQDFELYSLEVYEADETDIINEKSIPNTIARINNISWNDLKDKPFGEALLPVFTRYHDYYPWEESFDSDVGLIYGVIEFYTSVSFKLGQNYIVKYNDQSWNCVASETHVLGQDPNTAASADEIEYPFYVVYDEDAEVTFVYLLNVVGYLPSDFGIYVQDIATLDEKYIPDTIARVDDISESVTAEDVGLQIAAKAVRYDEEQSLSDDEKEIARGNIGVDAGWLQQQLDEDRFYINASGLYVMGEDWNTGALIGVADNEYDAELDLSHGVLRVYPVEAEAEGVRLRGLATGSNDTDAVNVKQLNDAIASIKAYIDETILGGAW